MKLTFHMLFYSGNGLALEAVLRFRRQQEEEQKDEGRLCKPINSRSHMNP